MRKFLILALLFLTPLLYSTDYYVDATDGNDANTGLIGFPWETIAEVNSNMGSFNPGDNIYFERTETWAVGDLVITCSGTLGGGFITFGAYGAGAKPDFNGPSIYSSSAIDYVRVENFNVRNTAGTSIYFNSAAKTNIQIGDCDVSDSATNGIYMDQIDTYIIEDCTVTNCANGHIIIYGSAANAITNGIVRNCDIVGADSNEDGFSFHHDGSSNAIGPNHYIYNCTATNCGEQGFDFDSANYMIIRDCTAYSQRGMIGSSSFGVATRVYFENFFSYDERDEGIVFASLAGSTYLIVANSKFYNNPGENIYLGDLGSDYIYMANNTFVDAGDDIYRIHEDVDYFYCRNNIISSTGDSAIRWYNYGGAGTADNTFTDSDYNCFYNTNESSAARFFDATEGAMSLAEWQATYTQDVNSQFANPLLTNPAAHNFELQQGSPAIDDGTWLTTITSASDTNTVFIVNDANWFHDGFGLTTGSEIQLEGDSSSVTITDINYGTDTITVDGAVTWTQGDGVAFAYNGSAPDQGAEESSIYGQPGGEILPGTKLIILPGGKVIFKEPMAELIAMFLRLTTIGGLT